MPAFFGLWFGSAPLRADQSPVKSAVRLGPQAGEATKAWVNIIPSSASRAMCGVRTSVEP